MGKLALVEKLKKLPSTTDNKSLIGTKVKLKVSTKKVVNNGNEYTLPSYTLADVAFEDKVKKLYKNYKIFLPDTTLSPDSPPGRVNIYIDLPGVVAQITRSQ